jgi:hypothetical protein
MGWFGGLNGGFGGGLCQAKFCLCVASGANGWHLLYTIVAFYSKAL